MSDGLASRHGPGSPSRTTIEYARAVVAEHLAELAGLFVPEATLTFVMRIPGELDTVSMLVSDDPDLAAVRGVINYLEGEEVTCCHCGTSYNFEGEEER